MQQNSTFSKKKYGAFSLIELSIVILIIGVLTAGVVSGNKLLDSARLSTARSLTKSSPIAGINDLYLWLDAAAEESFIKSEAVDGAKISTWYDINPQTLQKITLVQSTDAAKPTYQAKYRNSLPSVNFKAVTVPCSLASGNASDTPQQFTIFAVTELDAPGLVGNRAFSFALNGASFFRYNPHSGNDANSSRLSAYVFDGSSFEPRAQITALSQFNTITLVTTSYDGADIKISSSSRNATNSATQARNTVIPPSSSYPGPAITNSLVGGVIGRTFEVVMFSRKLTTEEESDVQSYLNKKWQIY